MKTMKSTMLLAAAAVAGLTVAGAASANVVNIQFEGINGYYKTQSFSGSQGAYTGDNVAAPIWNVITVNGGTGSYSMGPPLVASDDSSTGDAFSFTATGSYSTYNTSPTATPNYLLEGFITSGNNHPVSGSPSDTTQTLTLTGLAVNGSYQLYLYGADGYYGGGGATFSITTGSGSPVLGSNDTTVNNAQYNNTGVFTENANYVVFNATANASGILGISWTNPSGVNTTEGDFNGLQLISTAVPEPASLGLVALGGLGLLLMRRRRTA